MKNMDVRRSKLEDDEDWEGAEENKHRSSKSQKHNSVEEAQKRDSGRRRSSGDRLDVRKKSGSSSQASSGDENDYETRRESRSKISRKLPDDRSEKRSTVGYRERESESIRKGRDEENEKHSSRKSTTKPSSDNEISHNKAKIKVERSHESELESMHDKDSRYTERRESSSEKGHGHREQERNPTRRRWDEVETRKKAEENTYMDNSDSKGGKAVDHSNHGPTRDSTHDPVDVIDETKSRAADSSSEKGFRSTSREEKRGHGESSKIRGRLEARDEENVQGAAPCEARLDVIGDDDSSKVQERLAEVASKGDAHRSSDQPHVEKTENHKQLDSALGGHEGVRTRERSVGMDEDRSTQMRDRTGGEIRQNKRSRTPERSGRHHRDLDDHDRGLSESDNERNTGLKGKEREREGYRDDRSSKGTDRSWSDRNRDWQGSKDHWKRSLSRQDTKDRNESDHVREWEPQWHEPEMMDSEKLHSRAGYRRDGRIRTSLTSRNANDSSDSIEIRPTKNLDFGKEEPSFSGRRAEMGPQQDFPSGVGDETWGYPPEKRGKVSYGYGDELQERYKDDGSPLDQKSLRHSLDAYAGEGSGQDDMNYNRTGAGQSSDLQQPYGNSQGSGSFHRAPQQGPKGGRPARGRGRLTGRDAPRDGPPLPMMGPPFGHISLPSGPMQSIGPNMPHLPGPPIPPGVFIPPFPGPLLWPGARGVDMNMLVVPPSLSPMHPPGPAGPRFAPNIGSGPNQGMYFNQPGPGRGVSTNTSGLGFNATGPSGRGMPHEKGPSSWGQQRNGGPSKGPSRGEQNDYSQNFVDTGMRPQNFIRELELTSVVEDYPKLRELIQKKDEIVSKSASPPMYYKCDLREHVLSSEFFSTKFDVILVDPPWEEYVHRAPGVTDHMEYWTFEEIQNLKIEAIADTPSFIFLWVGDGMGLEQGRQCLKKWGFRRCEDICWVKTNKTNASPSLRHDSHTLFQHSKEHCLMGIKGTVRRSTDGHIIHANIDTDVIIAEEPPYGSTKKPDDLYRIIEHFSLGRRRLELFGEDHNIRSGWLTIGKGLSSSNFNAEAYIRNFADKDGKVWQGGGGRNPPPEAPHLVQTTPDIENLRPKSPPPKNQPQQSITLLSSSNSNNRRPMGNSPAAGSEPATPVPWNPSPMGGFRGPDNGIFEGFGFNTPFPQASGDLHEFESH